MAIRHVADEMSACMKDLSTDPERIGERIAQIGKQEGYDYIKPSLDALESFHRTSPIPEDVRKKVLDVITLLKQPEWEWRRDRSKDNICYFGRIEDGKFLARGQYLTGVEETGDTELFEVEEPIDCDNVTADPRQMYCPGNVRMKIFRDRGHYWLVRIGRVVDLIRNGFSTDQIVKTGWKGYFRRVAAYVKVGGPFQNVEEARQAKASANQ